MEQSSSQARKEEAKKILTDTLERCSSRLALLGCQMVLVIDPDCNHTGVTPDDGFADGASTSLVHSPLNQQEIIPLVTRIMPIIEDDAELRELKKKFNLNQN